MASHQRALNLLRDAGIDPQTGQRVQQAPPAAPAAPATPPPAAAQAPAAQQQAIIGPDGQPLDPGIVLEMLLAERATDRYNAAVATAVEQYPRVKVVSDRLSGSTLEEVIADAKRLDIALGGDGEPAGGQTPATAPAATPATPEPRVPGGAPSVTPPTPTTGGDPAAELRAIMNSRKPPELKMQEYLAFKRDHPGVTLVPGGEVYSSWDRTGGQQQG